MGKSRKSLLKMDWLHIFGTKTALPGPYIAGGRRGQLPPPGKLKCFFSNIVSDFAGLFLVAILVRNLTKTEFAPADKKS